MIFRVLVIGDGQEPDPRDIPKDSRFEVYTLPKNRGSYFARAVTLEATTTENHAVIDADDWVEPHWLETLLREVGGDGSGAAWCPHRREVEV